jgi:FKBP-type peptidyl-prolyl cis-trans isomerase 2
MAAAKSGDKVSVHYTGTLASGDEFDSSAGGSPLVFVLGAGQMIPGFDRAVHGMEVGETKTFTVLAAEAYGPHRPEAVQELGRGEIPEDLELAPGVMLEAEDSHGHVIALKVLELTEETVTLDANHPLAGEDLTFAIELVKIG